MYQLLRKLFKINLLYRAKEFFLCSGFIFIQACLAFISAASIAPLMSLGLGQMDSIKVLGYEFSFIQLAVLFISVQFIYFITNTFVQWYIIRYIANYSAWLKGYMLSQIMNKPYSYFVNNDSSVIQLMANVYTSNIGVISYSAINMFAYTFIIFGFVVFVIIQSPVLASVAAVLVTFYYVFLIKFYKRLRNQVSKRLMESGDQLQSCSLQTIMGVKFLRIAEKEDIFLTQYKDAAQKQAKNEILPQVLTFLPKGLLEFLMLSAFCLYILLQYQAGTLNEQIVNVGVMAFVAFKVFPLIQRVYGEYTNITSKSFNVNRVYDEIIETRNATVKTTEKISFKSKLSLQNVSFQYNKETVILEFPDIEVKRGEIVGIQGPSGCGKSTLIDLMLGLYEPLTGSISIDGERCSAAVLRGLHHQIGYVGQDTYLLNLTIAENISLDPLEKIDMVAVKRAVKMAHLEDLVESMPDGYYSKIGDRGVRLSGGQRQRLAIARALYRKPTILLLDEATSALDNETESLVMETIYDLPKEITIIMIAHRLSTLKKASKIIKLESS